jgi:hypothetical protein
MRRHVSPVLAWAWLAATVAANLVWTMPQFSLGGAAVRQNLLPSIFGPDAMPVFWSKLIIGVAMAAIAISVVRRYGQGSRGVKVFENILKVFVGIIVLCFVGVVVRLTLAGDVISWGQVARGFVPDLSLLTAPAPGYDAILGRMDPTARDFWTSTILNQQRDVMIATVATAVGILGPFLWSKAAFWLAVPVSVFGMCLLPIAYVSFHLMMNSRRALGHERPAGLRRWRWNGLMTLSVSLATMGSLYSIWSKTHWVGIVSLALLVVIALVAHGARRSSAAPETRVG